MLMFAWKIFSTLKSIIVRLHTSLMKLKMISLLTAIKKLSSLWQMQTKPMVLLKMLHHNFKTLYTNIPQDKLKGNLKIFISSIFKVKKKKHVTKKRAYFSDKTSKFCSFNENDIINQVNYLIDNCFIQYNKSVLQQVIGIPMGSNNASHMANIFLHIYEKAYIEHLIDEGNTDVIKNHGIPFWYQDNLIIFGNSYANEEFLRNMYPPEMVIKNTNRSANIVSYLDLHMCNSNHY